MRTIDIAPMAAALLATAPAHVNDDNPVHLRAARAGPRLEASGR
jgi:hypothetical protein